MLPLGKLEPKLLSTIKQFDSDYTRFDNGSYIGKLNVDKHISNPPSELVQILQYCLEAYAITNGEFNISIGSKLEKLGYGSKPDARAKVSSNLPDDIQISPSCISIAKHTRLDLGGIGKGWLIDKLSQILANTQDDFVINGGGDILVGPKPQTILIEHPTDATMAIGEVTIANGSLASSSQRKRTWRDQAGQTRSHIQSTHGNTIHHDIQPLSIHVQANDAKLADVLATTFMLIDHNQRLDLSRKLGVQFMEIRPDLTYWQSPNFGFAAYS